MIGHFTFSSHNRARFLFNWATGARSSGPHYPATVNRHIPRIFADPSAEVLALGFRSLAGSGGETSAMAGADAAPALAVPALRGGEVVGLVLLIVAPVFANRITPEPSAAEAPATEIAWRASAPACGRDGLRTERSLPSA